MIVLSLRHRGQWYCIKCIGVELHLPSSLYINEVIPDSQCWLSLLGRLSVLLKCSQLMQCSLWDTCLLSGPTSDHQSCCCWHTVVSWSTCSPHCTNHTTGLHLWCRHCSQWSWSTPPLGDGGPCMGRGGGGGEKKDVKGLHGGRVRVMERMPVCVHRSCRKQNRVKSWHWPPLSSHNPHHNLRSSPHR